MTTEDLEMVGALQQTRLGWCICWVTQSCYQCSVLLHFLQIVSPDRFVHIHGHFKVQPGRQDWDYWGLGKETEGYAIKACNLNSFDTYDLMFYYITVFFIDLRVLRCAVENMEALLVSLDNIYANVSHTNFVSQRERKPQTKVLTRDLKIDIP